MILTHQKARSRTITSTPPPSQSISAPTGLIVTPTTGQMELAWNAVSGATYYRVRRATVSGGPYTQLNTDGATTDTGYVDTDVSGTDPYYYVVRAVLVDGSTVLVSDDSGEVGAVLPQQGGSNALVPGSITGWAGFESLGYELPFGGDWWDAAGTATVRYSTNAGSSWSAARPAYRLQRRVTGTATAGSSTTITFDSSAGTNKNFYVGWRIKITAGTGSGQERTITAYPGAGRVATVDSAWSTAPNSTSQYLVEDTDRLFAGNLANFTPGQTVRVEVTVAHPDGINGAAIITKDIPLRSENITAQGSLTATRYLSASGSDSNDGSIGSPWRTTAKAVEYINAGDGVTPRWVRLGPGRYQTRSLTVTKPGGIFAEYPALDSSRARINAGNHAIIEYGVTTGPTGGDAPLANVWQAAQYTGPRSGLTYDVWEYTVSGLPQGTPPDYLGYADTYAGEPALIGKWKTNGEPGASDAAQVENLFENDWYEYGWCFSTVNAGKIILRMPTTASIPNPNDLYMTIGYGNAFVTSTGGTPSGGSTFRISGCEFRGYSHCIAVQPTARWHVYDGNIFTGTRWGINFYAATTPTIQYAQDCVVQGNLFVEKTLRAQPGQPYTGYIPWRWLKGKSTSTVGASVWQIARAGEYNEGAAIRGDGSLRMIFRNNTVDGTFNGVGGGGTGDRYASAGCEVYDNLFVNVADDCVGEHEPDNMFLRVFDNRAEYCSTWHTCADGRWGPQTFLRNVVWQWGSEEIAPANADLTDKGVGCLGHKISGRLIPQTPIEIINCTYWSDQPFSRVIHKSNSGNPGEQPDWYLRNNIMRTGNEVVRSGDKDGWDEDYCLMAAPSGTRVNENYKYTIASYRTATLNTFGVQSGANSNVTANIAEFDTTNTAALDALLTDPTNGDLTLAGSGGVGEGVAVPNFAPGTPNIGAE